MERTEKIGLGIATAGHVLLFGVLSAGFLSTPNPLKLNSPPMDVSLVDEIALRSTAPQVSREPPPPSQAPELGPTEEPAPSPASEPLPAPAPPPPPAPVPKPAPKPEPASRPVERAKPKPAPTAKPAERKPQPAKPAPPAARAKPAPAKEKPKAAAQKPAAKPAPAKPAAKPAATGNGKAQTARGSRLGPDFLKGIESEAPARVPVPAAPAATSVGPRQKAALDAEIRRQLKPFWKAPTGADAEQLRTTVEFELTPSGALAGTPEVVGTTGITASNRAQVKLHQELAVKAVRLAAPFKLPPDLHEVWKSLRIAFDKRLSQ